MGSSGKRRSPESRQTHRNSPDFQTKMSPEFPRPGKQSGNRKSPEQQQRKSSDSNLHRQSPDFQNQRKSPQPYSNRNSPELTHHRKSPEITNQRKSPEIANHRKSPEITNPRKSSEITNDRKSPEITNHKSPENNRRGSNSSTDGDKSLVFRNKRRSPNFEKKPHTRSSPPPRMQGKKTEYLITEQCSPEPSVEENIPEVITNPPKMLLLSDLPDEQLVRSEPVIKQLSEFEIKIREEEAQLKLQKEILNFLKKNWQEVTNELKDTEHEWPPKVTYYSNHFLF